MQVSLHSYSTSTGYHPTIKTVGFLARKFDKNRRNLKKTIKRLLKDWNRLSADTQIPERTDTKNTKETAVIEGFFGESFMNNNMYS